jgi:hypothetical protein
MPTVTFPQSHDLITSRPRRLAAGPYTGELVMVPTAHVPNQTGVARASARPTSAAVLPSPHICT